MAIFDFLRRGPAPTTHDAGSPIETKASRAATLVRPGPVAKWSSRNFEAFAQEGYTQNSVTYQAISRIGEAFATIDFEAWKGETELDAHPVLDLLKRPNPRQGWFEFAMAAVGYLKLDGNCYIEGAIAGGVPKELYALRPDRVTVHAGPYGHAEKFVYSLNQRDITFMVEEDGRSEILHLREFNPLDDWIGMSPVRPAAYAIDQHNEASKWIMGLLQNGAVSSGILATDADKNLTDDQYARLTAAIEKHHSGAANAGRPMLLEGGMNWQSLAFSPSDMGVVDTKAAAAREICVTLGVPPQLLGIPGDNTYSNYQEARLAFWEDTVIPLVSMFTDAMNRWLAYYYDGVKLRPNLDAIPAIAEKRAQFWAMANLSNELTVDEKRELKGYEPRPDGQGDVVLINSGQISLSEVSLDLGDDTGSGEGEDPMTDAEIDDEVKQVMRVVYGKTTP